MGGMAPEARWGEGWALALSAAWESWGPACCLPPGWGCSGKVVWGQMTLQVYLIFRFRESLNKQANKLGGKTTTDLPSSCPQALEGVCLSSSLGPCKGKACPSEWLRWLSTALRTLSCEPCRFDSWSGHQKRNSLVTLSERATQAWGLTYAVSHKTGLLIED